jgi:hypothetical protein
MITNNPVEFSSWFNAKYADAYRQVTPEDMKDMANSGLIRRYGYYSRSVDGELIRGILQYEQIQKKRSMKQTNEIKPRSCKSCGKPLQKNRIVS